MDSPAFARILRRLFAHETCSTLRAQRYALKRSTRFQQCGYRTDALQTSRARDNDTWQQRNVFFPEDRSREFKEYPLVTADVLRQWQRRPRKVKMLMRDFIEDSLYNPSYGYFPQQAVIFSPGEAIDFNALQDEPEFHRELGRRYTSFEDALDRKQENIARQLWHTPTEIFRPFYGEAIARYLVTNYRLTLYPYNDLLIYEMGAGNGTLMLNILDYIRMMDPEVYDRTKFKIVEISTSLANVQQHRLQRTAADRGHLDKVEIINRSIFDWDTYIASPCFFLAMEVFDNFAHDCIRYEHESEAALQASVLIDAEGDFYEFYERDLDPLVLRYLQTREAACSPTYQHPLQGSRAWRKFRAGLPFAPNLSMPEYIPTRLLNFFEVLHNYFPAHRLLTSDFHKLPDAVEGFNAPVVQTRYKRRTIPVGTPLVQQGFFDILFPTDFPVVEQIYRAVTGKLTRVHSHEDFLKRWAYVEQTQTKSGENPLLSWYKNASVLMTV